MWNDGWQHHAMFGDGSWFWPMGMHGVVSITTIAIILFAVFWVIRTLFTQNQSDPGMKTLADRYAAGEIDRDEFLARRKDLSGSVGS